MEPSVKMEIFEMQDGLEDAEQTTEIEAVTEIPVRLPDGVFIKYLTKFGPTLLSKSQRTSAKMKKNTAAAKISQMLRNDHGINFTRRQILKKLHNLKSKLKKKRDACAKDCSQLNLKPAENELLKLIDASRKNYGNDNSTSNILKISDVVREFEGNATEFITPTKVTKLSNAEKKVSLASKKTRHCSASLLLTSSSQLHDLPNNLETSETKKLSLEQLERMALLKQLKILDMQERLLQKQLIVAELRLEGLSK